MGVKRKFKKAKLFVAKHVRIIRGNPIYLGEPADWLKETKK
jgi:hypothetical protein